MTSQLDVAVKVQAFLHLDDKVEVGELGEVLILQRARLRLVRCGKQLQAM